MYFFFTTSNRSDSVAKKIKTFFKKLAIFLKKLAVFFENDLIFLRNTLVFEHVVFIYVRISLYNCIGLWICTYVKECVLLDERNTCSLHQTDRTVWHFSKISLHKSRPHQHMRKSKFRQWQKRSRRFLKSSPSF